MAPPQQGNQGLLSSKNTHLTLSNNMVSFTSHLPFPTMSLAQQQQATASFWDQPFAMQPFIDYYEITNVNVAGGSSLVIGAVYLFSFMYYHYILEQEQSKAALVKLRIQNSTSMQAIFKRLMKNMKSNLVLKTEDTPV